MNAKEARELTDKANGESQMDKVYSKISSAIQDKQYTTVFDTETGYKYIVDRLKDEWYYVEVDVYIVGGKQYALLTISW